LNRRLNCGTDYQTIIQLEAALEPGLIAWKLIRRHLPGVASDDIAVAERLITHMLCMAQLHAP
jgi:hypothetical protein